MFYEELMAPICAFFDHLCVTVFLQALLAFLLKLYVYLWNACQTGEIVKCFLSISGRVFGG